MEKGYYASGDHGSHWLFVDREGVILEVCNNASHVRSSYHTQGPTYFSWRRDSAPVLRMREADQVDFHMFRGASRDRPILGGNSISAMTVEIDPDYPDLLTCAWIALPARTVAVPVFMGQRRVPAGLFDGTANELGKRTASGGARWNAQKARWEALERAMHTTKEALKQEVKKSLAAGKPAEADIRRLEDWSRDQAAVVIQSQKLTD